MSEQLELVILRNLVYNQDFTRIVLPYIESKFFQNRAEKTIFGLVDVYVNKYKKQPTQETLGISLEDVNDLSDTEYQETQALLTAIEQTKDNPFDPGWLIETTEQWCKDRALYLGILESIKIMEGDTGFDNTAIPDLLSDALAISFDTRLGHDYLEDSDERYDFYHRKEEKIRFDLDLFNRITSGGLSKKTLNIIMSGPGGGKSLFMCHTAANYLSQGKNVLYITCEMAEERIAERIDANLFDMPIHTVAELPKDIYDKKIKQLKEKISGKLVIKEYATASANCNHFRILLDELKLKQQFTPHAIFIDYLNICTSIRYKADQANSYMVIKSIAEEIRGLAQEHQVPIISATQANRAGFGNTDIDMDNVSESFGLPATADMLFALITNDDLDKLGQIMVKQIKNRYNDLTKYRKFVIGVDRSKMKLFDLQQNAQTGLVGSGVPETLPTVDAPVTRKGLRPGMGGNIFGPTDRREWVV